MVPDGVLISGGRLRSTSPGLFSSRELLEKEVEEVEEL